MGAYTAIHDQHAATSCKGMLEAQRQSHMEITMTAVGVFRREIGDVGQSRVELFELETIVTTEGHHLVVAITHAQTATQT